MYKLSLIVKALYSKRHRVILLFKVLNHANNYWLKSFICLLISNLGCEVSPTSQIGKHLNIWHTKGIVIGEGVIIGDNVTIYQNVTIGQKNGKYPKIGNNCILYPNSVIFGGITLGDSCVVGAGSIVNKSFPENSVIAGNPAREIHTLKNGIN